MIEAKKLIEKSGQKLGEVVHAREWGYLAQRDGRVGDAAPEAGAAPRPVNLVDFFRPPEIIMPDGASRLSSQQQQDAWQPPHMSGSPRRRPAPSLLSPTPGAQEQWRPPEVSRPRKSPEPQLPYTPNAGGRSWRPALGRDPGVADGG